MDLAGQLASAPYNRPIFVSHKMNASPESMQSSLDSLVHADPSASTSTSDFWASPGSDASSYTDQHSPEHHSETHTAKRNSVFTRRNRSNTSTSIASSSIPVTSPTMPGHDTSHHRLSQDIRQLAGQSIVEINSAKRSLFRGKKGKRVSGSFTAGSPPHETGESDAMSKRTSVLRKSKRRPSDTYAHDLKPRISSPFDFKHLTHTDRHQFAALTSASGDELVAGFHNLNSSQSPRRDLTGIKAQDLRSRNSAEGLVSTGLGVSSPPMSPGSPREGHMRTQSGNKASRPPLRTARSVESFSRPGVVPRAHRHTQSVSTNPQPPRLSSRMTMSPINDLPEDSQDAPPLSAGGRRGSGAWHHLLPVGPHSPDGFLAGTMEESDYVGHALTTPDNTAIHPITPPFSPGLDDVVEEPERFASPRPAPLPPVRAPPASFDNFAFSNPRSPVGSRPRQVSFTSPKAAATRPHLSRPVSQCSDTLGTFVGMQRRPSARRVPSIRRQSNTWRAMEESWEDDIDYIYENALEADCDLEWDCASADGTGDETSRDRTPEQGDRKRISDAASHSTYVSSIMSEEEPIPHNHAHAHAGVPRPSLVVPNAGQVPELEMRSAVSASTIDTNGVHTPSDFFHAPHYPLDEAEGFSLTPSLLIPHEYKEPLSHHHEEDDYNELLADYEGSDQHFPLLESSRSVASSTRSSHFRSSKRSSYDSSLMSSGPSSGSWTAGVRRSASSSGSLPELVHSSRHARRDFNAVVDRLSQQVACMAADNDEEFQEQQQRVETTTPPVRASRERTFFTFDDEADENRRRGSVEADMKSSLELAQRGSYRAPPPQPQQASHKYASSDGVAKMLNSAPERQSTTLTRHRAASTATSPRRQQQQQQQQYFSLFPSPPSSDRL